MAALGFFRETSRVFLQCQLLRQKARQKNLSNENKQLCFCCLQETIFVISSEVSVLITEIF